MGSAYAGPPPLLSTCRFLPGVVQQNGQDVVPGETIREAESNPFRCS